MPPCFLWLKRLPSHERWPHSCTQQLVLGCRLCRAFWRKPRVAARVEELCSNPTAERSRKTREKLNSHYLRLPLVSANPGAADGHHLHCLNLRRGEQCFFCQKSYPSWFLGWPIHPDLPGLFQFSHWKPHVLGNTSLPTCDHPKWPRENPSFPTMWLEQVPDSDVKGGVQDAPWVLGLTSLP